MQSRIVRTEVKRCDREVTLKESGRAVQIAEKRSKHNHNHNRSARVAMLCQEPGMTCLAADGDGDDGSSRTGAVLLLVAGEVLRSRSAFISCGERRLLRTGWSKAAPACRHPKQAHRRAHGHHPEYCGDGRACFPVAPKEKECRWTAWGKRSSRRPLEDDLGERRFFLWSREHEWTSPTVERHGSELRNATRRTPPGSGTRW